MSFVIIIWDLSVFRRQLHLEVEQMYTACWIVVTWRRDQGVKKYVEWGLLILVTIPLLRFGSIGIVKVEIRFLFVKWPRDQSVAWFCWYGLFILSHHPAKFWVHRLYVSGYIMAFVMPAPIPVPIPMPRFTNDRLE